DLSQEEFHVRKSQNLSVCSSLCNHLRRHVHADNHPCGSHSPGCQERVESGTATQVKHRLCGLWISQRERVANPAKGFGHGGWQGIHLSRLVSQPLGTLGTDRELRLLVRCGGDPAEAVFDRGTEVRWLLGFGRHGDTPVETRLLAPGYRSFDPANRDADN